MVLDRDQTKLRELSSFLARMNGDRHHHVGYCGEQEGEVYSSWKIFGKWPAERPAIYRDL